MIRYTAEHFWVRLEEGGTAVAGNPALVNEDPMGAGWMLRLSDVDAARFATLLDEAAYDALTGN
ncbi:hypothetical protein [Pseudorhodoferax sp.]|uniref:hypothetical protein n=1 Tax=Pseudorhodoferax sp. TaxID=1993553 RepID=UPI002DD66F22|nr:hypothetical protein [Pseudorhodoferax sp.]